MRSPDQTDGNAVSTSMTKAAMRQRGTSAAGRTSQDGMDHDEARVVRAEGLDPDDPAVVAAIDMVRWERELSLLARVPRPGNAR